MHAEPPAGTIYWIDHYTIPTNDQDRLEDFHRRVLGAKTNLPPGQSRLPVLFQGLGHAQQGLFMQREPLPAAEALGRGYPRYALFVRAEDIGEHVRRLDAFGVVHSEPRQTAAEGAAGTSISWLDIDGNQFEFWAPQRLPDGAMDDCTSCKVGSISHVVYGSRDLQRTADFFGRYCALQPLRSVEVPANTLVLPLAAGGRLVFKQVDAPGPRTSGRAVYYDLHAGLLVREADFWPNYERMWAELPEWDIDPRQGPYPGDGAALPARTLLHGSPPGRKFKAAFGRGDDWIDPDANLFHFVGGVARRGLMAAYERHFIDDYVENYLAQHPTGPRPVALLS